MPSPRFQHVTFRVVFTTLRNGPTTDATNALHGSMSVSSSADEPHDSACRTFPSPTAHAFAIATSELAPIVAQPHVPRPIDHREKKLPARTLRVPSLVWFENEKDVPKRRQSDLWTQAHVAERCPCVGSPSRRIRCVLEEREEGRARFGGVDRGGNVPRRSVG